MTDTTVEPSPSSATAPPPTRTAAAPPAAPGRWQRVAVEVLPAAAFLVLLPTGWQVMALAIDTPLVPTVGQIVAAIADIVVSGAFASQLGDTLQRVAGGFAIAFVVAVAAGLAMARNHVVRRFLEPAIVLGLTIPGLIWALLAVIWFGVSPINPLATVALAAMPALTVNIVQGTRSVDLDLVEMAHVYRFSRWEQLRSLWLPALVPALFAGSRLGLSLAWKIIVLVEIFGMSSGVGYELHRAFSNHSVSQVLAWTLAFAGVMAILEYGVLQGLERRFSRWRKVQP